MTTAQTETFLSPFTHLEQVQEANRESGHHWFDPDTMKFFKSRIVSELVKGTYFITSEKPPYGPRAYSIREVYNDEGHVKTHGETCQYATLGEVRAALLYVAGLKFLYHIPSPSNSWQSCDLIGHFCWVLSKESETFAADSDEVQRMFGEHMMQDAKFLDRMSVEQCNTGLTDRQETLIESRRGMIEARLKCFGFGVVFNRDPRGNPVFVTVPSGRTDDFGQRGVTVPLERKHIL